MDLLQGLIRGVRNIRSSMNIERRQPVRALISAPEDAVAAIRENQRIIADLANVESLEIGVGLTKPKASATEVVEQAQLYVPLEGLIDLAAERGRLHSRMEKAEQQLAATRAKLAKPSFVDRAPAEIVQRERERERDMQAQLDKLRASLADLE